MRKNYIKDLDLFYEIRISKGKGNLTVKAINMLIVLSTNISRKHSYINFADKKDVIQSGLLMMLEQWYNFNDEKYIKAVPYFSELFKRGSARGFNQLQQKKPLKDKPILFDLELFIEKESF